MYIAPSSKKDKIFTRQHIAKGSWVGCCSYLLKIFSEAAYFSSLETGGRAVSGLLSL
jgi:hypothetical protein